MVIKGSSRGGSARDARNLAAHLLNGTDNEIVEVVEVRDAVGDNLHAAFAEWRAVSLGTRTRNCLYHASISVPREEIAEMSAAHWKEAVDELETRLGLGGHPRAVVRHRKHERDHVHVVWLRVNPATLKAASDSHNYRVHEATSRSLEVRFGLRAVVGAHTRPAGTPRPVAFATHGDQQAAERTGMSVAEVAAAVKAAWRESVDGPSFAAAVAKRGLFLARGDRGILVVDGMGTPHSIARRAGVKAAAVKEKLKGLDMTAVPMLATAKTTRKGRETMKERKTFGMQAVGTADPINWEPLEAWWKVEGFDPVREWNCLVVDAFGAVFRDYGNRIEIHSDGEPTDEQIAALVKAGRERGWTSVRFFGGSPDFQRRAREEAIRQGYDPAAITLECEEGTTKKALAEPMPAHLKRTLGIPDPEAGTPEHQEHREHRNTREVEHGQEAEGPRL